MEFRYFDVHSHVQDKAFDADRDAAILRMKEAGVGALVVGTDLVMSRDAVTLAEKHENLWAVIGQHPTDNTTEKFDFNTYLALGEHPRVVGIGECGLDYFHATDPGERAAQKELLWRHLELADRSDLPLMLHIRPSKDSREDAYRDALAILDEYAADRSHGQLNGNVHFFASTPEVAEDFVNRGFTLSFTGVITFARDYDEVIKTIPLTHLLSETDCPYVAPAPYRGKRNESVYVQEVVKKIAEIRGEPLETVVLALAENAKRVFRLSL